MPDGTELSFVSWGHRKNSVRQRSFSSWFQCTWFTRLLHSWVFFSTQRPAARAPAPRKLLVTLFQVPSKLSGASRATLIVDYPRTPPCALVALEWTPDGSTFLWTLYPEDLQIPDDLAPFQVFQSSGEPCWHPSAEVRISIHSVALDRGSSFCLLSQPKH